MAGVASAMDSELYKTVITTVDERIKEIKVTRKDFDDIIRLTWENSRGSSLKLMENW